MSPLQQPDPEKVTPSRAAAVCKRLGLHWAADPQMWQQPLPILVPQLAGASNTAWWVNDDTIVSYRGEPEDFPHLGPWASDDTTEQPARTPSVAAAILIHAWNDPKLRNYFDYPVWALDLEPFMQAQAEEQPEDIPHGFVRYHLLPSSSNTLLPVRRELIRLSRRDGRTLRPHLIDDGGDDLQGKVLGLTAADHAFHRASQVLSWIDRHRIGPRDQAIIRQLQAECFAQLMRVDELICQGEALRPDPSPFVPVLSVADGEEAIELSWVEEVLDTYAVGPGYVRTLDQRLRPLEAPVLRDQPQLLCAPLPSIPFNEAEEFLLRFVQHAPLSLQLDSSHLPRSRAADRITGIVRLSEYEDDLLIDLSFGYYVGQTRHEQSAESSGSHLSVGGLLLMRDTVQERRLRTALEQQLGREVPTRLRGDRAFDFLLTGPTQLGAEFEFYGNEQLRRHRVVGDFSARVHIPSGLDWLDVQLEFEVAGHQIGGAQVLRSWQNGERYHRLPDGTLARLPQKWLEEHGQLALELEEMKAAHGGQLQPFAAPLVAPLLAAQGLSTRWQTLLEDLHNLDSLPLRPPPKNLHAQLRSYQLTGFRWLHFLHSLGLGACLADDMGLGKTVQAITFLLDAHTGEGERPSVPSLVVAPTSVVYNWADELRRFAPDLRVYVHHGAQRDRAHWAKAHIVITSYALLRFEAARFQGQPWHIALLDEAQHIKNPNSQLARAARALPTHTRVALTGTPLENHLIELWSIFEFLMPGFFGSRAAFMRRYAQPIQRDRDTQALRALRRRLGPFILRRHKLEVAQELPPRQEQVLYCELGPAQRALYERVKATYRNSVLHRVQSDGLAASTLTVLEALMRLRQACCDPGLLPFPEAESVRSSAKRTLLLETLEEIIDSGHRTLVFSQWPSLLKRMRYHTQQRGWASLYLDGATTKRHELVEQWNDPQGPPIFFISLRAGGSGLNLTGADHVIHLDPWWNPAVEDQATDRAHRIGQTRPVVAYKLVVRDTVEEKILELQLRKRALFEATVEQDRMVAELLTREDLEAVFAPDDSLSADELGAFHVLPDLQELPLFETDLLSEPPQSAPPAALPPLLHDVPEEVLPEALRRQLEAGETLTNALVRKVLGHSTEAARRWLRERVERGQLEQRGQKRGTHYVLSPPRQAPEEASE